MEMHLNLFSCVGGTKVTQQSFNYLDRKRGNMKRALKSFFILWGIIILCPRVLSEPNGPYSEFKTRMDSYNKTLFSRTFTKKDALAWWDISDSFVLSLLNSMPKTSSPSKYLSKLNGKEISAIGIVYTPGKNNKIILEYNMERPPTRERQYIDITISPLISDDSILFVQYFCIWRISPKTDDPNSNISSFRILERDSNTGKYKITARNEDTNFYRKVIAKAKIKDEDGSIIPDYLLNVGLRDSSIKYRGTAILFDVQYPLCTPGSQCFKWLTVNYEYKNHLLIATKYEMLIQKYKYDSEKGMWQSKTDVFRLSP
jgi:hypothetical protein